MAHMVIAVALAFVAGLLTILAPCVLPVIPMVLGASSSGGRRRSLGIFTGFSVAFLAITILLASILAQTGLTTGGFRIASAVLLGLVGLTIVMPRLGEIIGGRLTPIANLGARLAGRGPGDGLAGGLVLGVAIGLVWAPCVGPLMAGVIASAAVHGPSVETLLIAGAYVLGTVPPLALVARWGSRVGQRADVSRDHGRLRRVLGATMVASALLVVLGLDVAAETAVAGLVPGGGGDVLAGLEHLPPIQRILDAMRGDGSSPAPSATAGAHAPLPAVPAELSSIPPIASSLPQRVALDDLGPAPDFTGIQAWINSQPLAMASLRGKVVLVEFWTFACSNCNHVQPYVIAWNDRYASSGLVVIGVHTPELSFERELSNVRNAVSKAGIRYAVAVDPGFSTWNAYRNSYWPAMYFIDKTGQIRHTHFGEGDYAGSEQVLRELLAEHG
jgi:cytochrome c biogenesis protein CcdA/thiol-disulfide isomerase/thioredoxin